MGEGWDEGKEKIKFKMKQTLILITIVLFFSCKKETKSKTEVLPGTEAINSEASQEVTQEEVNQTLGDVFNSQIKIEVDETVFVIDNGSNRVTEDMSAGIMTMLAPQPYDQLKAQLEKEPNQEGYTLIGIEEIEREGKIILQQKSKMVDEVGDEMIMMMHALPAGDKTMMISSFYPKEEESKYLPLIEKSVLSAKLK